MTKSVIIGCGSYLPAKSLSNADLAQIVDTNDQWIVERTGIKTRHIVAEGEFTSDMAYHAASRAIENAGIQARDIDLIIVATTTADCTFPATATKVQKRLNVKQGAAFDVQAVCAGFIYALNIADNFIKTGQAKNVLVIGADTMSRIVDWQDRATCVLFGDGAGAVILSATSDDNPSGVIASKIYADGSYDDILYTSGGVSTTGTAGVVKMLGREVFKHAVEKMTSSVKQLLAEHNFSIADIDLLIPHQANMRILEAVADRLSVTKDKVITTVTDHANTSAATIPLAIDYAYKNNLLNKGDLLVLSAIGGGLSWGSSLIRC